MLREGRGVTQGTILSVSARLPGKLLAPTQLRPDRIARISSCQHSEALALFASNQCAIH